MHAAHASQGRDFLEEILARRRVQVAHDRETNDPEALHHRATIARGGKPRQRLRTALRENEGIKIIGEFKRASPSLGAIRSDLDPAAVAGLYEAVGVCGVSILTEPDFFHGSLEDLRQARAAVALPILRKDFIVDEFQIDEAAVAGADAILLIVAALSESDLLRLRVFAEDELGLDALVEVHSAEEIQRAANSGATLIGVNNRDLRTFVTSLETSLRLASLAPAGATLVSESGISRRTQIEQLEGCGYHGVLVGEALMRAVDPAALLRSWRGLQTEELHRA